MPPKKGKGRKNAEDVEDKFGGDDEIITSKSSKPAPKKKVKGKKDDWSDEEVNHEGKLKTLLKESDDDELADAKPVKKEKKKSKTKKKTGSDEDSDEATQKDQLGKTGDADKTSKSAKPSAKKKPKGKGKKDDWSDDDDDEDDKLEQKFKELSKASEDEVSITKQSGKDKKKSKGRKKAESEDESNTDEGDDEKEIPVVKQTKKDKKKSKDKRKDENENEPDHGVDDEIEDDLVDRISKVELDKKKSKKGTVADAGDKYESVKLEGKKNGPAESSQLLEGSDKEDEECSAAADGSAGMFTALLNSDRKGLYY